MLINQTNNPSIDDLRKFMGEVRKVVAATKLRAGKREEVAAHSDTVEAQLRLPKPSWPILKESLTSLRSVLENAAGNVLGEVLARWPLIAAFIAAAGQAGAS